MGWIERAFDEIDEQLECGDISDDEHRELTRGIHAEAEMEAEEIRGEFLSY
jgi:hypothetical protein